MKFCIHYSISLLVLAGSLINGELAARDPRTGISVMTSGNTPQYDKAKVNMLVVFAGAAAGGKQNTCYFLK
ncbi:MAG TPA: hypothetical protein VL651_15885, partial [Bacteroidia bacterium]|nr:hypothetical protein [Bacteroidia bacterium]